MNANSNDGRMDYIEFPATDISNTEGFYINVFGWKFTDYGPEYTSFEDGRLSGRFRKEPSVRRGGPLVVIYAIELEAMEAKIRDAGAEIVKPTFSFPGGRRFHFADPNGNELAVWSDK
jgi:predicted enzyme related to lactoylglutathione lyase